MSSTPKPQFLMVEATRQAAPAPILDALTRKATALYRHKVWTSETRRFRGWHTCICGAQSDNRLHKLRDVSGPETNSLLVHYVAYHRDEISADDRAILEAFNGPGEDPTAEELAPPGPPQAIANTGARGRSKSL